MRRAILARRAAARAAVLERGLVEARRVAGLGTREERRGPVIMDRYKTKNQLINKPYEKQK